MGKLLGVTAAGLGELERLAGVGDALLGAGLFRGGVGCFVGVVPAFFCWAETLLGVVDAFFGVRLFLGGAGS